MQILFIQGGGADVHDAWDDKIVDALQHELGPDYAIDYPRMPDEDDPHYPAWKAAIGRAVAKLDAGAVLIGHSLGGTMLVHALAEDPPAARPGAIVLLAAPFVGEGGWPSDEIAAKPGLGAMLPEGVPVHLFHGTADETAPVGHADLWAAAEPGAVVHRLDGPGHQLEGGMGVVAGVVRRLQ